MFENTHTSKQLVHSLSLPPLSLLSLSHYSAGLGRSGTYIGLDLNIRQVIKCVVFEFHGVPLCVMIVCYVV